VLSGFVRGIASQRVRIKVYPGETHPLLSSGAPGRMRWTRVIGQQITQPGASRLITTIAAAERRNDLSERSKVASLRQGPRYNNPASSRTGTTHKSIRAMYKFSVDMVAIIDSTGDTHCLASTPFILAVHPSLVCDFGSSSLSAPLQIETKPGTLTTARSGAARLRISPRSFSRPQPAQQNSCTFKT